METKETIRLNFFILSGHDANHLEFLCKPIRPALASDIRIEGHFVTDKSKTPFEFTVPTGSTNYCTKDLYVGEYDNYGSINASFDSWSPKEDSEYIYEVSLWNN